MIVYISTKTDKKDVLISDIANKYGVGPATQLVNRWFEDYSELCYDDVTLALVFYKKYYSGYWESTPELVNYKKK